MFEVVSNSFRTFFNNQFEMESLLKVICKLKLTRHLKTSKLPKAVGRINLISSYQVNNLTCKIWNESDNKFGVNMTVLMIWRKYGNFLKSHKIGHPNKKLRFYIHTLGEKKSKTHLSKIWHRFPSIEIFWLFCFHRKLLSLKNYEQLCIGSPHPRPFLFFFQFHHSLFFSDLLWLKWIKGIINFHLRPHLLKIKHICWQKELKKN